MTTLPVAVPGVPAGNGQFTVYGELTTDSVPVSAPVVGAPPLDTSPPFVRVILGPPLAKLFPLNSHVELAPSLSWTSAELSRTTRGFEAWPTVMLHTPCAYTLAWSQP